MSDYLDRLETELRRAGYAQRRRVPLRPAVAALALAAAVALAFVARPDGAEVERVAEPPASELAAALPVGATPTTDELASALPPGADPETVAAVDPPPELESLGAGRWLLTRAGDRVCLIPGSGGVCGSGAEYAAGRLHGSIEVGPARGLLLYGVVPREFVRAAALAGAPLEQGPGPELAAARVVGQVWAIDLRRVRPIHGVAIELTRADGSTVLVDEPSATGSDPQFEAVRELRLIPPGGGVARGRATVLEDASTGALGFELTATGLEPTGQQAYGMWLVGGDREHFLGFAPPVGDSGELTVSGPRVQDATAFAGWLAGSAKVWLTREAEDDPAAPGPVVLSAEIAGG